MATPDSLDAYILGSGIASLTAAVHLIQEAKVPPNRVHILETLHVAGATTASSGDAESGFDYRAGMRPPFNDGCMTELLSLVPSDQHPGETVRDDILRFAAQVARSQAHHKRKTPQTRFLVKKASGVVPVDARKITLGFRDRIELFLLGSKTEKALGRSRIQQHFSKGFFRTGYWLTLSTTFGFKPTHSAVEFRRHVQRFHDLHSLQQAHPIDAGPYNTHESIIAPMVRFLMARGVDFRFHTTVTDILFSDDLAQVTAIATETAQDHIHPSASPVAHPHPHEHTIQLSPNDIVIVSLGSISSAILAGANDRVPPPCLDRVQSALTLDLDSDAPTLEAELDENWLLWLELATKNPKFGNAYNFCTRLSESRVESFTITTHTGEFFSRLLALTGDIPGPRTLVSLRDSPWLITLRIPHQPAFPNQPESVQVCWGYALYPERKGEYIEKPMMACSGREIFAEILHQLQFVPVESILEHSMTIPHIIPRGAATLLPRNKEDRPQVVPPGIANLALIGPFVDIPDEVVVSMEYSVRGAQIAVRKLMGIEVSQKKAKRTSAINLLGLS